jgi:preprotein translocase subunit YajC
MHLAFLAQAGQSTSGGGFLGFLPFILILVIIYFLMLRPQMKRQKQQAAMIAALQKNDEVVTSGGLHGRIVRINEKDTTMLIQIARGVVITVERSSVSKKKDVKGSGEQQQISAPKDKPDTQESSKIEPSEKKDAPTGDGGVVTTAAGGGERRRHSPPRRRNRRPAPQRGNRPPSQEKPSEQ